MSAGWNFSQVLLNVHCSLQLSSKHLHWTKVRNLIWSSEPRTLSFSWCSLARVLRRGAPRASAAMFRRGSSTGKWKFFPVRKNFYFGPSSKHWSRRLVLMSSSEPDCRQAFCFSERQLALVLPGPQAAAL